MANTNNHTINTYKKPGQTRAFFAIAWYALRAQTRNPATFFFGFIFPLVFISIFGLIGGSDQKIIVGVPTSSQYSEITKALEKHPNIKLEKDSLPVLEERLQQGKISGIFTESVNNMKGEITLQTSNANPQNNALLLTTMKTLVAETNIREAQVEPSVTLKQLPSTGRELRYIDFALPGQIGFALLSTALFGTVFGLIYLKKAGILKRMFATPTKPLTILLAQGLSRLVVALSQTMLILLIGVLAFKFYLPQGIWTFLQVTLLSAVGLVAFLGFGYFIAGLSNDENSASPLTNIVTLPQFLLSGTFFSTENFPAWVQPIANNLPLSYFNQALRKITTEGGSFPETFPYMLGLLIWGAVMYILAAKTFKWE